MGISTDAILAYGYNLGEDIEFEDTEDEDFGEILEQKLLSVIVGFDEVWSADKQDFWERKREAQKELGLEIVYHCSNDYPMFFLATYSSRANRGYPKVIKTLKIEEGWNERLTRGMEALSLKSDGPPAWYLMSMWS